jgi:hypothetical protein
VSVVLPGTAVDCGLNVQLIPVGTPGHVRFTFPVKPLLELRLSVKFAELPTAIVAELAETAAVMVPTMNVADFDAGVVFGLVPVTVT